MNYKSSMTDVGNEMIAQAHKDDKAIIFDSFLVSEALSDTGVELTKTTKNLFSNPLTYPINSKATSDNTFTVKAVLANKTDKFTVDEDFSINVIGVLAHIDGSSDSRLITIAVAEGTGAVITAFRDTLYSLTVAITQAYKADQPANFGLANVAYALADDLDKLKTDIQIIIDGGLTDVAKINEANTFTEAQKFDKGATDGKGNAYATTKDVAIDLNNGLSTKVTDNHDGTEQLSGIQVQPYNKLSDVTSVRNIVLQTDNAIPYIAKGGIGEAIQDFSLYDGFPSLPSGTQVYYSYDLVVKNADGGIHWFGWDSPWSAFVNNQSITTDGIHHFQGTTTIPDANITKGQFIHPTIDYSHATYQVKNLMVVVGSIPVTHLPAPEDKVNVADMRKPASDVAGIEEVNAKQDKLEYTPANAANVVDRNPDTGVVSEPVDFTKLTVNGGKSVATSDDLKSLEDASWHTITGKSDSLSAYTCMYRKNNEQKYVDLVLYGTMGITMGTSDPSKELLDLSEIISSPKNVEGNIAYPAHAANGAGVAGDVSVSGTKILFSWKSNNSALYAGSPIVSTGTSLNSPFLRVTFN